MAKKKAAAKKARPISKKKRKPLAKKKRKPLAKKKADTHKAEKRLSRRKRSDLKRYDQTLSSKLYSELVILAEKNGNDLRMFVESCLRASPKVRKHLKENNIVLPDRPVRGNPDAKKK